MSLNGLKFETDFYVTARDGKDIFVRHATAIENSENKAVILAHGITGNPNEYIHMSARNFFVEKGYDVYRMSFYDDADNARKLHTTTLPLQANDMNDVIAHVKKAHDKVFVCGHSYGGATMLFANPQTTANAFWDSSFDVSLFWQEFERHENTFDEALISKNNRMDQLFSKEMLSHANEQSAEDMIELASTIKSPSIVITAETDPNRDDRKRIYDFLTVKKEYTDIKGADHQFLNGNTIQDLLTTTHTWFERF